MILFCLMNFPKPFSGIMSTRSQKRKAARQQEEEEDIETLDQDLPRVRSVELVEVFACDPCTSTSAQTSQNVSGF